MGEHVVCGGLTFEGVPVEMREKVAFRDAQLPDALPMLRKMLGLDEAVLVSTCNRVEYFGATPQPRSCGGCMARFFAAISFDQR